MLPGHGHQTPLASHQTLFSSHSSDVCGKAGGAGAGGTGFAPAVDCSTIWQAGWIEWMLALADCHTSIIPHTQYQNYAVGIQSDPLPGLGAPRILAPTPRGSDPLN